jgi:predicted lysophospholipase L1 biosynthesis ABC-type transport system permease subunit
MSPSDTERLKPLRLNPLLAVAALICFSEIVRAPRDSDPGPLATAVLGLFLIRRAIIPGPQPIMVILSGLFLTALAVASNHGLISSDSILWLGSVVIAFVCFTFWERIVRLMSRRQDPGGPES